MKTYKVVPGPKEIVVEENNTAQAFSLFENIINEQASQGWELCSLENILVTEKLKKGCFLFSKNAPDYASHNYYMLIFSKEV